MSVRESSKHSGKEGGVERQGCKTIFVKWSGKSSLTGDM